MASAHEQGKKSTKNTFLILFAVAIPLTYFILVTFVFPRTYFIQPADIEQDYYYNSKLMYNGFPPLSIYHPGTPIQSLGALIMDLVGDDLSHAQDFFNVAYFTIAIANIAGLIIITKGIFKDLPIGFSLLALFSVVSFPGWLAYSHTFGADSFLTPVVLALLTCFWVSLDLPLKRRTILWAVTGALAGLILAIKLTSLPLVIAFLVSSWIHAGLTSRHAEKRNRLLLFQYFVMPVTSIASFLLFISPTFARLPQIFISLSQRHETHPLLFSAYVIFQSLKPLRFSPYLFGYFLLIIVVVAVFILVFVRNIITTAAKKKSFDSESVFSRELLLSFLILAFGYTLISVEGGVTYQAISFDPGVFLRNTMPSVLFMPFAIAYIYQDYEARKKATPVSSINWMAAAIGVITFGFVCGGYMHHRSEFIQYMKNTTTLTEETIRSYADSGTRIAVWDGSPGNLLGEASFHFWGNYAYAREFFDEELLKQFPDYTFLKLREVNRLITHETYSASSPGLLGLWKNSFPSPYYIPHNDELVTGESGGARISVLAFPKQELEAEKVKMSDFLTLVQEHFGAYTAVDREIGNLDWVIIVLSPRN